MRHKPAEMSEFMGVQFFFEQMTRKSMEEYGSTRSMDSRFIILGDKEGEDGEKKIANCKIDNFFEQEGIHFMVGMLASGLEKAELAQKFKEESDNEIIAVFERHLVKRDGKDTILTIHNYRGVQIKRVFVAEEQEVNVDADGDIHFNLTFSEVVD
jgi:hypothetical protein